MNAAVSLMVEPASLAALATYLAGSGSNLSPGQAAACAIGDWLASRRPAKSATAGAEPRGYRWKCLFLPESTQIRMVYRGRTCHAQVIGDDIVYDGQRVSPRQMTLLIAGEGRNAWRDLLLRFPGESTWTHAMARRNALARQAAAQTVPAAPAAQPVPSVPTVPAPPTAPTAPTAPPAAETFAAAAAAMAQVLKGAFELVERVERERAYPKPDEIIERRTERRRRTSDLMEDDCRND